MDSKLKTYMMLTNPLLGLAKIGYDKYHEKKAKEAAEAEEAEEEKLERLKEVEDAIKEIENTFYQDNFKYTKCLDKIKQLESLFYDDKAGLAITINNLYFHCHDSAIVKMQKNMPSMEDDDKYKEAERKINDLEEKKLQCLDAILNLYDISIIQLLKAETLQESGRNLEAVRLAIKYLPYAEDEDEKKGFKEIISGKGGTEDQSMVYTNRGYGIDGRSKTDHLLAFENWGLISREYHSDNEDFDLAMESSPYHIAEIRQNKSSFLAKPYHERMYIYTVLDLDHIGGVYDPNDNIQYVFAMDELPKDINFPTGHPQPNTLYYAHPFRPLYLPFEQAEETLFHERLQEICHLCQCLGAKQISFNSLQGRNISTEDLEFLKAGGSVGYKAYSASADYGSNNHSSKDTMKNREISISQSFAPLKAPYLPDDLFWGEEDIELQNLIKQRIDGGLLHYHTKISSKDRFSCSNETKHKLEASVKAFVCSISGDYSNEHNTKSNSQEDMIWDLEIDFYPLDALPEIEPTTSPEKLIMPLEQYGLVEGYGIGHMGILQNDVKLGDKVLISNGITTFRSTIKQITDYFKPVEKGLKGEKRVIYIDKDPVLEYKKDMAIYLDKSQKQNKKTYTELTPNEIMYKEEVEFCLDGTEKIQDEDRRFLERKRIKLGISPDRAAAIEKDCMPQLLPEEKEFVDTVKDLMDGRTELSDRIRKILKHESENLGISEERANELQAMVLNEN